MGRRHSGLHPDTRTMIEELIVDSLSSQGRMTVRDMRYFLVQHDMVPRSLPLNDRRLALICRSLYKKGILEASGTSDKRLVWSLKHS